MKVSIMKTSRGNWSVRVQKPSGGHLNEYFDSLDDALDYIEEVLLNGLP